MTATSLRIVVSSDVNPAATGEIHIEAIRKRLSSNEVTPTNIRFIPPNDTYPDGMVQQTFDGGETWVDKPLIDPRHSPIYQFPPRGSSSDTTRCDAAANLRSALETVINILIDAPDAISVINGWLNYVVRFMPEIGFIITILQYIHDLLATLKPYLTAAFTSEVYDGIQCFMYCRLDESGQMNSDGLGSLITDICTAYDSTVCTVCQAVLQTWWSTVGCNNASAIGSETGDCTDCACQWCYEFDFTVSDYGLTAVGGYVGCGWSAGVGIYNTGVYGYSIVPFNVDWYATRIEVDLTHTGAGGDSCLFSANSGGGISVWVDYPTGGSCINGNGTIQYRAASGSQFSGYTMRMNPTNCYSGEVITFRKIRFYGAGECPFGEPNC